MSVIAAAYSSYTTWSISQVSTAAADVGYKDGTAASSSVSSASVTTVSISVRAKQLLARASGEQFVVGRLRAQLDAFRTDRSVVLRGRDAGDALSDGMDLFKIIGGSGNDFIRAYARATIDAGAGNDVIDT